MSQKLLIIDDNSACSDLYKMRFEYDKWTVKVAVSAEEAEKTLADFNPDAILLDLMLPGMQGDIYLEKLRSDLKTKNTVIVLLTALNLNQNDQERISKLADAVIIKIDLMPNQLVKKVVEMVRAKKGAKSVVV